jgi:hypothetical protein
MLGDNKCIIKKTEALIAVSKEVSLEANIEIAKFMSIYCHQNVEQNHNIKIANSSFQNVEKFKYLGITATY